MIHYHKLNKNVTPIAAPVLDVVSLDEQTNLSPGLGMQVLIGQMNSFSTHIHVDDLK